MLSGALTFSMAAGMIPGRVSRVQAENDTADSKPAVAYYATKEQLMTHLHRMLMENPKISENWSLATEKKEKAGCHRHGMFLVLIAV